MECFVRIKNKVALSSVHHSLDAAFRSIQASRNKALTGCKGYALDNIVRSWQESRVTGSVIYCPEFHAPWWTAAAWKTVSG